MGHFYVPLKSLEQNDVKLVTIFIFNRLPVTDMADRQPQKNDMVLPSNTNDCCAKLQKDSLRPSQVVSWNKKEKRKKNFGRKKFFFSFFAGNCMKWILVLPGGPKFFFKMAVHGGHFGPAATKNDGDLAWTISDGCVKFGKDPSRRSRVIVRKKNKKSTNQ